ncbi:Cupredoxin [Tricladium varicosporioides]|nr:Cupredoxin [Hymenoscyphus varicosporioides]
MGKLSVLALLVASIEAVTAGWDSPVYQNFFSVPLPIAPIKQPKAILTNNHTGKPIHYYEIEIKPLQQQVYPGKQTRLVGYDGISPGPTFMMEKGIESIVRFINHGDRANSVHLHGSYSRAPFDGWAEDTTPVGSYKDYYYPNNQNARTLWYHDHAIDHTAENAYYGQAGFYILHDPEERAMGLPEGKYDIPLALAAKRYNADFSLWDPEKNGETTSVYGDVIHVNGQPWPFLEVEPRKYRFRWCNTGISRTYRLYLELTTAVGTKLPFTVIGSDAGLLEKPIQTDNLYISMAERWEIVIDFTNFAGKSITVRNDKGFSADTDFTGTDRVMQFKVLNKNAVTSQVGNGAIANPLRKVPYPPNKAGIDRSFTFERSNGQWQINGVTWSQVNNRIMAKPQRGAIEVWQLENKSGGWSHPIHIHLIDFQVMFRTGGANRGVQPYEAVALKDVVWLGPNEKVIVMARYAPWDGVYMFHCHNLIHEDHEMMAAFNVSLLNDFNYTETTHFIDPMEPRYRATPIKAGEFATTSTWGKGEFSQAGVKAKGDWFSNLDAYTDVEKIDLALEEYWHRTTLVHRDLATTAVPEAPASTLLTSVRATVTS